MSTTPADLNNVQGDIVVGFAKKLETAVFFQIDNVAGFRKQLGLLVPKITTATQVSSDKTAIKQHKQAGNTTLLTISGLNVAFSQFGLTTLGITDDIGDSAFKAGQLADAQNLGDEGSTVNNQFTPDWLPPFKSQIHGVIIAAGDSQATVDTVLNEAISILQLQPTNGTCHEVTRLLGAVRPGAEKGHEHFGFLDGISNPAVENIDTTPFPGQETVRQGIILLGRNGDTVTRPSWALDGSFLAFRYLFQLVPEFNNFLAANPISGLPPDQGADLLGARLVGRWKSGAPVDLTPLQDDPALGADPQRNNNFNYGFPDDAQTQDRCPFAAHVRKTNPRLDLEGLNPPISTETRRIIRRGIPFGPELDQDEITQKKTLQDRGLLFRCYQSNIPNGFQFVQVSWANNVGFPIDKPEQPGFDAIIGQTTDGGSTRTITGTDPNAQTTPLPLPAEWVLPKGGEYFFSPSIPALQNTFASA